MHFKCAILGTGNIGTDLMVKIVRTSKQLELAAFVGIDPESEGLKKAKSMGIYVTAEGINGLLAMPEFPDIDIVFDATSAKSHIDHNKILVKHGKKVIDLTPAAIGPFVVPVVNFEDSVTSQNVNMVTCAGQATIPIVYAVSQVTPVAYAEIVASVSSRSAGPGTRANIDEFTRTTEEAVRTVGCATKTKAIIVLNPAEPPMMMRDTVYTFSECGNEEVILQSILDMVDRVHQYVPGYRLKHAVQFENFTKELPLDVPGYGPMAGLKTTVLLEVEGAGHFLPPYAGNLDIMTSAALAMGEKMSQSIQ